VDTTEKFTHVSFCSGYDGIGMGLDRVIKNLRTVAYVEIEAFACSNLVAKMEKGQLAPAPIWTNLKTFDGKTFCGKVDIVSAGYPCQPFSNAGKRVGTDDPRHLWPCVRRAVRDINPRFVFLENVEGHISLGLNTVISDLAEDGYTSTWGIFSAKECGAPHQRKRVFILAYDRNFSTKRPDKNGTDEKGVCELARKNKIWGEAIGCRECDELADRNGDEQSGRNEKQPAERRVNALNGFGDCCAERLADCGCSGFKKQCWKISNEKENNNGDVWPARPGEKQYDWEPPRVVANAKGGKSGQQTKQKGGKNIGGRSKKKLGNAGCERPAESKQQTAGVEQSNKNMGNAASGRRRRCGNEIGKGERFGVARTNGGDEKQCEAQSTVGGNVDGVAGGVDYAELCESCDNRVDELRLLGNGVVPATAAKAFLTLYERLEENG